MNVQELIAELKKMPQELEVVVAEAGGDEYVPVVQVLYEDGTSEVALLDHIEKTIPVHPYGSCGGVCHACGDQP
jgi:hypothetical protein